jgi:Na+-driven multidrug efflux pump
LVVVAVGFAAGLALLPAHAEAPTLVTEPPWWDLPARALASLALVVALSAASGALGPSLSGLLAPFPIITSVLAVFTQVQGGTDRVRVLLRNFLVGFYGFAAFCFVLAAALDSLGGPAAFSIAVTAALTVQATIFALRSRHLRPRAAEG